MKEPDFTPPACPVGRPAGKGYKGLHRFDFSEGYSSIELSINFLIADLSALERSR